MASDPVMDEMKEKQQRILKLMEEAARATDTEKVTEIVGRIQIEANALEALGKRLAAQTQALGNRPIKVALTPDQRKRVQKLTGVDVDVIELSDHDGWQTRTMPWRDPRIIEYFAIEEAKRRKHGAEADRMVRRELTNAIEAIEAQGNPELQEQLDALKADPKFAGGLLKKK
jgi:hypothetical protein